MLDDGWEVSRMCPGNLRFKSSGYSQILGSSMQVQTTKGQ